MEKRMRQVYEYDLEVGEVDVVMQAEVIMDHHPIVVGQRYHKIHTFILFSLPSQ